MQNQEPIEIPEDTTAPYWKYQTQHEINYEHILKIQSEILTIHAKIDKILEWIASK
jgi:hypothetical protein